VIDWLERMQSAFEAMRPLGYVLFAIVYVLWALVLLPESICTILAGALLGMLWGTLLAWISAIVAAVSAFEITRVALRKRVEKAVEKNAWLKAVNRALPREGWKVVALARLSPLMPFGLQNYFFGVTKVSRRSYIAATAIAILPGTFIYAFLGATGRALLGSEKGPLEWSLLGAGVVATIVLSFFLGRLAKKRLNIGGG
jgi:uncharacterized membrane protein YdjX (TVP38/TMEM64 family)